MPLTFICNLAKVGEAITYSPDEKTFVLAEKGRYEIYYQSMGAPDPSRYARCIGSLFLFIAIRKSYVFVFVYEKR